MKTEAMQIVNAVKALQRVIDEGYGYSVDSNGGPRHGCSILEQRGDDHWDAVAMGVADTFQGAVQLAIVRWQQYLSKK